MGPTTIGRYRLVKRVGAGGMGIVYEAVDMRDSSKVALKVLLPHAAEEKDGLLRFRREFRALARLRHPNIVRVYDAGIEDDVPFIAMEFLEGKDVRAHLRAIPEGPARDREMRRCLRQIFGALAHIHARRIVHRDLKPENIQVCSDGRVKLMDFGVARLLRSPTSNSGLLGTFAYMAPEQVTTGEIDGRSDLYAVGVLMYEVLTGNYPFPVEPPAAALHHHVNTPPEHVLHVNPKADPTLAALTQKLLEKDPLDRLQTAEEAIPFLLDGESPPNLDVGLAKMPGQLFVPRFVSRQSQLDFLEGVAQDAGAGRGRLVLVEGPSGLGKSRLIEELRLRVRRRMHVLIGACARERSQPYGPVQAMLDQIEAIAARAPEELMQRVLGRDLALVHAVSPRLAALGGPATTAHLDPNERKIRMHKAIVGVIGRLALVRPVVLVFEDVHWADSSSMELIWDAARTLLAPRPEGTPHETVCPVAVVLTRRSLAEGHDHSEQLVRRLSAPPKDKRAELERLVLAPIDHAGVSDMLRTMTGVARPLTAAVEELTRSCHGNPLIIQELVQTWVAQAVLVREGGAWLYRGERLDRGGEEEAHEGGADTTPGAPALNDDDTGEQAAVEATESGRGGRATRVRDDAVALRRLEGMSRPAVHLVERLALLGRILPADLVFAVAKLNDDDFLDVIDELVRGDVLLEEVSHDGVRYRFYHEGFREAVARGLTKPRRARVHLSIARSLELRFRARRRELSHVLARHWKSAGHGPRAVPYLVMMAQTAAQRGDLAAALRRLEDARLIIDEAPRTAASATRRLRILLMEIDLYIDFGRAREALDRADPQAAIYARSKEVMAAELTLRRAAAQFALGRMDETLATLSRLSRHAPTRSLCARFLELEGRTRMARGEFSMARTALEQARGMALGASRTDLAKELEAKLGIAMLYQGDYLGAQERLEQGLLGARARGDSRSIVELVGHIGMVHSARGHSTEALACYKEAIELAEARGVKAEVERWAGELGMLMTQLGSFGEAEEKLGQALALAREAGSRQREAAWRGELGIRHALAGELERAQHELNRCLAIAREIGFMRYEAWAHLYLGTVLIEREDGDLAQAREHIEQGLELAEDLSDQELLVVGLLHLGRLEHTEGRAGEAERDLERARALAGSSQNLRLQSRVEAERQLLGA